MADTITVKKITELTADSSVTNTDLFAVGDAGGATLKKVTFQQLATAVISGFTGVSIGGSQQTIKAAVDSANNKLTNLTVNGVGASTDNLWPSATNLLTVTGTRNGGVWLVNDIPANLSNCPISGDDTFIAYRRQGVYSGSEMTYAFVELIEIAPVTGRHWVNHYYRGVGNWQGWKRIDNLDDSKQSGTVTVDSGLSVSWKLIPSSGILNIAITGTTSGTIPVASDYYTLATIPAIAAAATSRCLKIIAYNSTYKGQLNITTAGRIQLGYARSFSDNAAVNIASGQALYINEVFMLN